MIEIDRGMGRVTLDETGDKEREGVRDRGRRVKEREREDRWRDIRMYSLTKNREYPSVCFYFFVLREKLSPCSHLPTPQSISTIHKEQHKGMISTWLNECISNHTSEAQPQSVQRGLLIGNPLLPKHSFVPPPAYYGH